MARMAGQTAVLPIQDTAKKEVLMPSCWLINVQGCLAGGRWASCRAADSGAPPHGAPLQKMQHTEDVMCKATRREQALMPQPYNGATHVVAQLFPHANALFQLN